MRKNKDLEFDEASSGESDSSSDSDSDSDNDSSDDEEQDQGRDDAKYDRKRMMMPASDSEGDSSNDADNDNDESSDDDENPTNRRNDEDDSDDDEDDSDEEDLPLHERIRKREQQGLAMQEIRERKSQALKTAGKRLADLKRKKSANNDANKEEEQQQVPKKKKKKSKHAPTEVSSKRADYFRRGVPKLNESGVGVEIGANRYKALDPRTSNLHGHLSEEQFEKNYAFLEEMRNKEISDLKKQIAARKVTGKKGTKRRKRLNMTAGGSLAEDQEKLRNLKQEKAEFERRKIGRAAKQSVKRKIREEVEEGKRGVFFLKRKEKRRLEMEAKLDELRKRGGDKAVDKAIERRRQKNKSRDASRFVK